MFWNYFKEKVTMHKTIKKISYLASLLIAATFVQTTMADSHGIELGTAPHVILRPVRVYINMRII